MSRSAEIYLDHASTTPIDPRVLATMRELAGAPLNPSSVHRAGQRARRLLEDCRERLANLIGLADPGHVLFTSGATESANLAIRGLVGSSSTPLRVAASDLEHSCVRETLELLSQSGCVDLVRLSAARDGRAVLAGPAVQGCGVLALMHGNNETGVIQPVQEAARLRREKGFLWICDVSQSLGKVLLDCGELGADLVFGSSHKAYGPPGVGFLGGEGIDRLRPQITGGAQEEERRAGTQPVLLIAGFVRAVELAHEEREERQERLLEAERAFLEGLSSRSVPFRENGVAPRLPGLINLSFPGFEAMDLVIALDQRGIAVSPGSACSTGVVALSPVLAAMYPEDRERAGGGVRISFGKDTTVEQAGRAAEVLAEIAGARVQSE